MDILVINQHAGSVGVLTTAKEIEAIIAVFDAIAAYEGWQPDNDLYAYVDRSIYLAALEQGQIVGGLQLVLGEDRHKLPCMRVWPEVCLPRQAGTGHVLILALDKGHRGRLGFFGLLSLSLWRKCKERGITELWLEATPAKLKVYRRLGWPLRVRGDLREHWGEPCLLCSLSVAEAEAGVRSRAYWQEVVALADQRIE